MLETTRGYDQERGWIAWVRFYSLRWQPPTF